MKNVDSPRISVDPLTTLADFQRHSIAMVDAGSLSHLTWVSSIGPFHFHDLFTVLQNIYGPGGSQVTQDNIRQSLALSDKAYPQMAIVIDSPTALGFPCLSYFQTDSA